MYSRVCDGDATVDLRTYHVAVEMYNNSCDGTIPGATLGVIASLHTFRVSYTALSLPAAYIRFSGNRQVITSILQFSRDKGKQTTSTTTAEDSDHQT